MTTTTIHHRNRLIKRIKRTEPRESKEKVSTWFKRTCTKPDSHQKKVAFIEFSMRTGSDRLPVVCIADRNFCTHLGPVPNDCVFEVTDKLPETWCEGFDWRDLNILPESFVECRMGSNGVENTVNLDSLRTFIRAFGWKKRSKMFVHIWRDRLPDPVEWRATNPIKLHRWPFTY